MGIKSTNELESYYNFFANSGKTEVEKAPTYSDNIFSVYLYTGTGSSRSVTNGIDLSGEGGMVWIKNRTTASSQHTIMDTERGAGKQIHTDDTMAQGSGRTDLLSSFNSNGFSTALKLTSCK